MQEIEKAKSRIEKLLKTFSPQYPEIEHKPFWLKNSIELSMMQGLSGDNDYTQNLLITSGATGLSGVQNYQAFLAEGTPKNNDSAERDDSFKFPDKVINELIKEVQEDIEHRKRDANELSAKLRASKYREIDDIHNNLRVLQSLLTKQNIFVNAQYPKFDKKDWVANFIEDEVDCVIMSIDIRKSTELMKNALDPKSFASFIIKASEDLAQIIKEHFGIFDKFTGDGILAFFPKFYSGDSAISNCLRAAHLCHLAFEAFYELEYRRFANVIANTGLGIGIDYGKVKIISINNDLTVVGRPVVFACRLSGIAPGTTGLNSQAVANYENTGLNNFDFEKLQIEPKHESIQYYWKAIGKTILPDIIDG